MVRRLMLLFVVAAPLGLLVVFGPPKPAAPATSGLDFDHPNADTPIVAIRGQPLAEFEEPLPPGARVRFGSTRFRHPNDLSNHESALVGRYLISVTRPGSLTVTDTVTGKRVCTEEIRFRTGRHSSFHVTASPDGQRFLVWDLGGMDENLAAAQLWQIGPDVQQPVTRGPVFYAPVSQIRQFVDRCQFAAGGREVILAGWRGLVVFDAHTGGVLREINTETEVLDVSASGNRFLTWSVDQPLLGGMCGGGLHWVPRYRFRAPNPEDADRRLLKVDLARVPVGGDRSEVVELHVRDSVDGSVVAALPCLRTRECILWIGDRPQRLSRDGRYAAAANDSEVRVWHVDSGRQILHIRPEVRVDGKGTDLPRSVAFASLSRLVVTGLSGRRRAFDVETSHEVPILESDGPANGWLADPETRVVVDRGIIRRRDTGSGRELPGAPGYSGVLMDGSADGTFIAIGDATGRLDVWLSDGRLAATLRTAGKSITAVAFSRDGKQLAACDRDRVLLIWSVGTWRERQRIEVPADDNQLYPDCLTFSPDGRGLLVSRNDILALWDLDSASWVWDVGGRDLSENHSPTPAFAADGRSIIHASGGSSRCTWLDVTTGEEIRSPEFLASAEPPRASSLKALAFCPDGKSFALVHDHHVIKTHNHQTTDVVQSFPESRALEARDGVLRFSPDGRRLVTCDDNGHAHVWEVASGQLAFTLNYPDGDIADAFFSHDGRSLITANHREVIVWDLLENREPVADPWTDLGHDAPRAEQARRALLADPAAALDLLRTRLRPAVPLIDADVQRLIRALDADDYRAREQAAAGLLGAGRRVLPSLKAARLTTLEGIGRQAALVQRFAAGLTPNELRHVRGIEVLEQINTSAARKLVAELATGDPAAVLTEEARKSARASNGTAQPIANPRSVPKRKPSTTVTPVPTTTLWRGTTS